MSAHTARPGHRPRRSAHPAIRAGAAAIIVLALAACGSTTTTPATSTTATAIPSGGPGILTGAGSTYVAPFFALAFARYHQQHPAVTVNYAVVGSSAGIAAISARQVDFGASDVPMNASELAAAKGGPITQVPDALGAEGVAYNLDLPAGARLHLTGPVLAAIFLGQITHWNDPAITALNPGITLPARRSKSCTAPTAVAPPTSSATTCPASTRPGRPRSAPARRCTGQPGKAPKATAV